MNREIKFRARNNKCWIYCGAIINGWAILNENGGMAKINPETIGQYTGLKDKNGKEIYEGDIILTQPLKDKPFSQKAKSKRLRGIVKYQVLCGKNFISEPDKVKYWGAEWDIEIIDKKDYEKYHNYGWGLFFECEVIGNIYDNPELLGGMNGI